jgi:riboflavin transporter FmnP
MILGWIGVSLLLLGYVFLAFKRTTKYFLLTNAVGSIVLTLHAITLNDTPFIIVNSFIAVALFYKQIKGGIQ